MKDMLLTISSKGQITLPKRARDKLGLRPGSKLRLKKLTSDNVVLEREKTIDDYYGVLAGYWTDKGKIDPADYVRELRDREK